MNNKTLTTKYEGAWTPSAGITMRDARETLRMFPQVRDGASLNALAMIIDHVSHVVEIGNYYEFSLCPHGHLMVSGIVNFD